MHCTIYRYLFLFTVLFTSANLQEKVTNLTLSNSTSDSNRDKKVLIESPKPVVTPPSGGREGVVSPQALLNINTTTTNNTANKNESVVLNSIAVNSSKTLQKQDEVKIESNNVTIPENKTSSQNVSVNIKSTTETLSKISPRKGVTLPESLKIPEVSPAPAVKKPLITDVEDHNYNQPDRKSIKSNMNVLVPDNKEHKRAAYLIPIIAVIFSVPLVAAIISVLYKRGSEWWQHRHYRRMDFLIEGMYNN